MAKLAPAQKLAPAEKIGGEYGEGKIEQQIGIKKTRAQLERERQARLRTQQISKERQAEYEAAQQQMAGVSLADYAGEYQKLSPTQQSYFKTPAEVAASAAAQKATAIKTELTKIDETLASQQKRYDEYSKRMETAYKGDYKSLWEHREEINISMQEIRKRRASVAAGEYTASSVIGFASSYARGQMETTQPWQQVLPMEVYRETKPRMEFVAVKEPSIKEMKAAPGFLTVTKTPSLKEQWTGYKEARGSAILGTLTMAGVKLRGFYEKSEYKAAREIPGYRISHLKMTGAMVQAIPEYGPFFTPVGPYLITGAGVEHIATPYGREFIKTTGEEWEKQYKIPFTEKPIPKEAAWAIPVAEIALGTAKWWYPKVKGEISTWGRKEVKFESPSYQKVVTGEKMFPELGEKVSWKARTELHYKEFMKPGELQIKYGYKAGGIHMYAGEPSFEMGLTRPLHIAPATGPSPYFMKVPTGKVSGVVTKGTWFERMIERGYGDIFQPTGKPGAAFIEPTKFEIRYGKEISRGRYVWAGGKPAPGVAAIPGTKAETQAVFESTTKMFPTGGKFYFKYRGVKYPIDTWRALGPTDVVQVPKAGIDLGIVDYEKVAKSYIHPSVYKYKYPYGVGALVPSYKLPVPSYKPSYAPSYKVSAPSYKPSPAPSYKPSVPSYKPSYAPSLKPSKISYKPTYKPSYKPSAPSYPPSRPPTRTPSPPPPPVIRFPKLAAPKRKPKPSKAFRPSVSRKPSLIALGEGLKATKPYGYEPSGLMIRPFIVSKKEKKKKRRSIFAQSLSWLGGLR